MDTRYHDQGYSATFVECEHGASLAITLKGKILADIEGAPLLYFRIAYGTIS